jgi:hypothetical protein
MLIEEVGAAHGIGVTTAPEAAVASIGRPDIAVFVDDLLTGYVEFKAPGTTVRSTQMRGRDREQWGRFSLLPNVLYSNGEAWALYRRGELVGEAQLRGDPATLGDQAVDPETASRLSQLLELFLRWEPIVPERPQELAVAIAPLCRFLTNQVKDAAEANPAGAMASLWTEWRQLLFHDADLDQFADAYAQTVTFSLLLARVEGGDVTSLDRAVVSLRADHGLLAEVLRTLATSPVVAEEVGSGIKLIQRAVQAVEPDLISSSTPSRDPWLYFYEDFLAEYDHRLRDMRGAYYTPAQVVAAQVRLVDEILRTRLGKPLGFGEEGVVALDPAAGTGSYPLRVLEEGLARAEQTLGQGAIPGVASRIAQQLLAFELLVGPYAVCQLRMTRALEDAGALLPDGPRVYLTDTLESPNAEAPGQISLLQRPLAEEHARAQEVKRTSPVLVCMGNPPYDDQRNPDETRKGGWVRFGDEGADAPPIYEDFLRPARDAGYSRYLRYAYNDYLYFWRWAVWKVCEQDPERPGVVSFISASSYLQAQPYIGMREHLRRQFDEIWIIDLEGEATPERQTSNVFDIRTPVAIAICMKPPGPAAEDAPATVRYTRLEGSRPSKLAQLDAIRGIQELTFQPCPNGWQDPFFPALEGEYAEWPSLTSSMPWHESGVSAHRMWPIAPRRETLQQRWDALVRAEPAERPDLFVETSDRVANQNYTRIGSSRRHELLNAITSNALEDEDVPDVEPFGWCFLDRQWIIADNRVLDRPRPRLWAAHSPDQLYMVTKLRRGLGAGPAVGASKDIPDFNFFGSGSGRVFPLYRDREATQVNIDEALLREIERRVDADLTGEDVAAYIYAMLCNPAYTEQFARELEEPDPHIPFTVRSDLFVEGAELGRQLLWLHSFFERFADPANGRPQGTIHPGRARSTVAIPPVPDAFPQTYRWAADNQTLYLGDGAFGPVSPEVWDYRVITLRVLSSWLDYRVGNEVRRPGSELERIRPAVWDDADTRGLLELLWILERTVSLQPRQADWFQRVLDTAHLPQPQDSAGPSGPSGRGPATQPQRMLF